MNSSALLERIVSLKDEGQSKMSHLFAKVQGKQLVSFKRKLLTCTPFEMTVSVNASERGKIVVFFTSFSLSFPQLSSRIRENWYVMSRTFKFALEQVKSRAYMSVGHCKIVAIQIWDIRRGEQKPVLTSWWSLFISIEPVKMFIFIKIVAGQWLSFYKKNTFDHALSITMSIRNKNFILHMNIERQRRRKRKRASDQENTNIKEREKR